MLVYKRSGIATKFDKNKIIKAINKAFIEVDGELYEEDTAIDIAEEIEKKVVLLRRDGIILNVENI
jgi:hypothetical protein